MRTFIDEEPDDTLAIKFLKLAQVTRKDAWKDPEAFRRRFVSPFTNQLKRAGVTAYKVEAYAFNSLEPEIVLIARPQDALPLE